MSTSTPSVKRPETEELKIVAIKIPRVLIALLDNAAGDSWQTRNTIIRQVLEDHFNSAKSPRRILRRSNARSILPPKPPADYSETAKPTPQSFCLMGLFHRKQTYMADKNYNEAGFFQKLNIFARIAGHTLVEKALQLYYAAESKDTPKWAKGVVMGALAYFRIAD